jgi:hypothetical protein
MRTLFGLVLLLAACGAAPAGPALPADATIMPAGAVAGLFRQCSRGTPSPGEGTWQPTGADIAALEAALPAALRAQREAAGQDWGNLPAGWRRQYGGIVRGGRRFVYGNFYPRHVDDYTRDPDQWRHEPVMVCDGGAAFFGVEYDVAAHRFTHFGFNGSA